MQSRTTRLNHDRSTAESMETARDSHNRAGPLRAFRRAHAEPRGRTPVAKPQDSVPTGRQEPREGPEYLSAIAAVLTGALMFTVDVIPGLFGLAAGVALAAEVLTRRASLPSGLFIISLIGAGTVFAGSER